MEFLSLVAILSFACILVVLLLIYNVDADLTTTYYDKFGKSLGKNRIDRLINYAVRFIVAFIPGSLKGQVVWITGASSGIGEQLALQCAEIGSKLVLSARSIDKLEEVKRNCIKNGLSKDDVLVLQLDNTKFEDHKSSFDRVLDHFGRLDVLIHNAGVSQRARWEFIDLDVDRYMFDPQI